MALIDWPYNPRGDNSNTALVLCVLLLVIGDKSGTLVTVFAGVIRSQDLVNRISALLSCMVDTNVINAVFIFLYTILKLFLVTMLISFFIQI